MKHPKIVIPALLVLVVLMFMVGGSPDQSLTGMPKILAIVGVQRVHPARRADRTHSLKGHVEPVLS